MAIETLVGIRSEDLESPDLVVRRKALEMFARNERILLGALSPRTAADLRCLADQVGSLPDKPR